MNQILDQQFELLWKQVPSCTPSISVACQSSLSPSPIDLLDNILSQFDTFFDDDIFNNDAHLPDTKATEYNDDTLPMTSYNSPLISNDISEIGTSNTLSSTQYFDAKSDSTFEAHHSKQDFDISYYSTSYALDFYHPGTSLEFNQDHYFTFAPSVMKIRFDSFYFPFFQTFNMAHNDFSIIYEDILWTYDSGSQFAFICKDFRQQD